MQAAYLYEGTTKSGPQPGQAERFSVYLNKHREIHWTRQDGWWLYFTTFDALGRPEYYRARPILPPHRETLEHFASPSAVTAFIDCQEDRSCVRRGRGKPKGTFTISAHSESGQSAEEWILGHWEVFLQDSQPTWHRLEAASVS